MIEKPQKMMSIFVDQTDMWRERPLYEAIVHLLERHQMAGATVVHGVMGYGVHRRIHRKGIFGVSDEKPVLIMVIDSEERIRSVLPAICPMVKEGLITLQDTEVVWTGSAGQDPEHLKGK